MFCNRCESDLHEDAFNWKKINVKRQSYCKSCQSAYTKEHYEKNKQPYLDRAKLSNVALKDKFQKYVCDYLSEHPCVECGETNILFLEFDHFTNKDFNITSFPRLTSDFKKLDREIEKCQILCIKCHRIKTAIFNNNYRLRYQFGMSLTTTTESDIIEV